MVNFWSKSNFFNSFLEWKFNSIKVLKNDQILITEPVSNDLIILDTNFEEIKRLKGIKGDSFGSHNKNDISSPCLSRFRPIEQNLIFGIDNEAIRNSTYTNEGDCFIWFKGGSVISIVNTRTLEFLDLKIPHSKNFKKSIKIQKNRIFQFLSFSENRG